MKQNEVVFKGLFVIGAMLTLLIIMTGSLSEAIMIPVVLLILAYFLWIFCLLIDVILDAIFKISIFSKLNISNIKALNSFQMTIIYIIISLLFYESYITFKKVAALNTQINIWNEISIWDENGTKKINHEDKDNRLFIKMGWMDKLFTSPVESKKDRIIEVKTANTKLLVSEEELKNIENEYKILHKEYVDASNKNVEWLNKLEKVKKYISSEKGLKKYDKIVEKSDIAKYTDAKSQKLFKIMEARMKAEKAVRETSEAINIANKSLTEWKEVETAWTSDINSCKYQEDKTRILGSLKILAELFFEFVSKPQRSYV